MQASQVLIAGGLFACGAMIAPAFGEDGWNRGKLIPSATYTIGNHIKISHNGLTIGLPRFGLFNRHGHKHEKVIVNNHHHYVVPWPVHDPWW